MEKIINIITLNPLILFILILILFLIGICIFKLIQPDFTTGINLKGHIGELEGNINLNLYENFDESCPCGVSDDGNCRNCNTG